MCSSDLVRRRLRHANFIDRQRDHPRAKLLCQLQPIGGMLLTVFEVDGVYDRLAAMQLQRLRDQRGSRN